MWSEIGGEDFSGYSVESQTEKSGPGRPSEIASEILRQNVIELQFVLEQNWGEVGWLLSQAETEHDIRTAFQRIVNPRCSLLEPFTRDHPDCTGSNLRKLRKREKHLGELRRRHLAEVQENKRNRDYLFRAWATETDTFLRGQMQHEIAKSERDIQETATIESRSRKEQEALRAELSNREAHFAQSEILKHLQTNRRRFTPLNVAKAMAGLPLITARVSVERCTIERISPPDGIKFEMFRMIERAFTEPLSNHPRAIDALQKQAVSGPEKGRPHAAELRTNWYFIKLAIESAARDADAPFGSLPFRVFAGYCSASSSHSMAEWIRARAEGLVST